MEEKEEFIHEDLKEREQISADVKFESNVDSFDGLNTVEFKIKKKVITSIPITNVKFRAKRGELF